MINSMTTIATKSKAKDIRSKRRRIEGIRVEKG